MKTKTPLTDEIYPREPAIICTGTALERLVKLARKLEVENAELRALLERWEKLAAIGLVDVVPDWAAPVVTRLAVDTSDAVNATRKEQP